ncbi:MAG: inorganic phosphate transporter [Chloroflexi bacterium]|nr:inorganic phosphate transporter [Chloroflexota bacterium]
MSPTLTFLLITSLLFNFLNGLHDSSNIVATPIASHAMTPRKVLWLAAAANFAGPFLFGVAVAETIGTGITDPVNVTMPVIIAALLSAVVWNVITWWLGIPSSSSHALIGGLVGAVVLHAGVDAIHSKGLITVTTTLFVSPILGMVIGYLLMNLTLFLARGATPKVNRTFRGAQVFTTAGLALIQGANDAQKTMGIITLGLLIDGRIESFAVPLWVIFLSALTFALCTATGGWRLIKTLGYRIYKIRPVHGFVAQISGTMIILGAALIGGPVSTTQVMSSSIMGAGSAERLSKVRWLVGYEMLVAWMLTIPISAVLAGIIYLLASLFIPQ